MGTELAFEASAVPVGNHGQIGRTRSEMDIGTGQTGETRPAAPDAPEGNRTPGLQLERLASIAIVDSGSSVTPRTGFEPASPSRQNGIIPG